VEGRTRTGREHGPVRALLRGVRQFAGPLSWRNLRSWALVIGVFMVLQWAVIAPFRVPTQSMHPTLNGDYNFLTDDRVLVNKWIYGLRYPFNRIKLPFSDAIFEYAEGRLTRGRPPARWDIVVFKNPEEEDPARVLVKRVAGLPGERVALRDGKLAVDGEIVPFPADLQSVVHYTTRPTDDDVRRHILEVAKQVGPTANLNPRHAGARQLILFMADLHEKLRDVDVHALTDAEAAAYFEGISELAFRVACEQLDFLHAQAGNYRYGIRPEPEYREIPPGCYFLLGDNSAESRDGRTFGWTPEELIMGRAFAICWPPWRMRDFTGFSSTWWGRALLFGVPALMVCYELCVSLVVQSWRVQTAPDGSRMRRGDRILVNRIALGLRLPFTDRRISGGRELRRGEYAVYAVPKGLATEEPILGQVTAVPGDTVAFEGGRLRVNGRTVRAQSESTGPVAGCLQGGATTVPDGSYVLLTGANDGLDSLALGWICRRQVYGAVSAVWWPLHRMRRLTPDASPDGDRMAETRPES